MVRIRRLKSARVDSVIMFSGREFQVLQAKYLKCEDRNKPKQVYTMTIYQFL